MTCAEIEAGFRQHGEWLRARTAELDVLLEPVPLSPIARLLLDLHESGVLGEKFNALSGAVPEIYRCDQCKSPRSRMKSLETIRIERLGPIVGFAMRCRICGGKNGVLVPNQEEKVAA